MLASLENIGNVVRNAETKSDQYQERRYRNKPVLLERDEGLNMLKQMLSIRHFDDLKEIPGFSTSSIIKEIATDDQVGAARCEDDSLVVNIQDKWGSHRSYHLFQDGDNNGPEGMLMSYFSLDMNTGIEEHAILTSEKQLLVTCGKGGRNIPYMIDLSSR